MQLEYSDGSPINSDLTGAVIKFSMKTGGASGTALVTLGSGQILDAANKVIGYQWQDGDTDVVSDPTVPHLAEFKVLYSDETIQSFPNSPPPNSSIPYIKVHI